MTNYLSTLVDTIKRVATEQQRQWLDETLAKLASSHDLDTDLPLAITRARRFVGQTPLGAAAITTPIGEVTIQHWEAGNAARVALLLKAIPAQPEQQEAIIATAYRMGDEAEKAALIAAIALYADDARYKEIALDAGRTNSLPLFRALATGNPYPGAYYTEAEFNQLVLKLLFLAVNTEQVVKLQQRINPELSRMCEDYYDERIAAQRSVPADIWLSLTPYASEHGYRILAKALTNEEEINHRYYAAMTIARYRPASDEINAAIETQLDQEKDERIRIFLRSYNALI
jgi:hypothetical protein